MPITELYSGVKDISASEISLSSNSAGVTAQTISGVYQTFIDVSDMIAGDVLQIRVYEKARTGDTQQVVMESILTDAQAEPMWVSPSMILMRGWDFTANVLTGTVKTFWSIRQIS